MVERLQGVCPVLEVARTRVSYIYHLADGLTKTLAQISQSREGESNVCQLESKITLFPNIFAYLQENRHENSQ